MKIKFVNRFIAVLAAAMCTVYCTLPSDGNSQLYRKDNLTSDAAENEAWIKLYEEKLNEYTRSSDYSESASKFDLYDIDSDGIPELFISMSSSTPQACQVYTINDNKLTFVGNIGTSGRVYLNENKKTLLSGTIRTGWATYILYEYNNYSFKEILKANDNTSNYDDPMGGDTSSLQFMLDDVDVSFEEYSSAVGRYDIYFNGFFFSYDSYIELGRKYDLNKEKISSVLKAYAEENTDTATKMGDIDGDGIVDSTDASLVLAEYSRHQTGKESTFTAEQKKNADTNKDGLIDSSDASRILAYYADISTGKTPTWD